jgi:endonuclease/exonuclease/phosphatase (EEP) superfamily protein YafD
MSERSAPEKGGSLSCWAQAWRVFAAILGLTPFVVWGLQQFPGESWWASAALVYGPGLQWVALPALGLLLAVAGRSWQLSLLNLGAAALALLVLAGYQVNTPPPLPKDRPTIRVATWNVYGWTDDRDLVRRRVLSWDCDIVCLQESRRSVFRDLLPGYEETTVADLTIYARGEILRREVPEDPNSRYPRTLLAEVQTRHGLVTVINAHLPRSEQPGPESVPRELKPLIAYLQHAAQIRAERFAHLVEIVPSQEPVILAGDLNTPPASRHVADLSRRLTDSFDAVGRGFGNTFVLRGRLPLLRIDYIFTGGGVTPLRCETREHDPSDHRPVVAELALPAQGSDLPD